MLRTLHCRREHMQAGEGWVAKFMPRWDGKYKVTEAFPDSSVYRLHIPTAPENAYTLFHASELKPYLANDDEMFPGRRLQELPPVVADGEEEYVVDRIVDQRRRGRGLQYRVQWKGYGIGDDSWLSRSRLNDCEALDRWEAEHGA